MSNWTRSNVSREQLLRLVEADQLPPLTTAVEWKVPGDESVPCPKGFVVSFVAFHEHGFSVPAGRFIRGCCSSMECNSSTSTRMASRRWRR
jgi:hypothetical protein